MCDPWRQKFEGMVKSRVNAGDLRFEVHRFSPVHPGSVQLSRCIPVCSSVYVRARSGRRSSVSTGVRYDKQLEPSMAWESLVERLK